jgi:hypothetical protein
VEEGGGGGGGGKRGRQREIDSQEELSLFQTVIRTGGTPGRRSPKQLRPLVLSS